MRTCAVAQAVSGPLRESGGLGLSPGQVMWDLWWIQRHRDRFSPSTSVSSATNLLKQLHHNHRHLSSEAGSIGQKQPQYIGLGYTQTYT
jgi:hypothetical protein